MTASIQWDNEEKTVLLVTYGDPIKIDEVFANLDKQEAMLDSVDHEVTMIIDMTTLRRLPPNSLGNYPQIAKHRGVTHSRVGTSYVVIPSVPIEYIISIFSRLYIKFQTATSLEEARQRISERVGE